MQSILMPEFMQRLQQESLTILDIREDDEYASGHIPQSIHMPMSQFHLHYQQLDREKTYYVLCYSGSRSLAVCQFLAQRGYRAVNIMGGISTYRGPLE